MTQLQIRSMTMKEAIIGKQPFPTQTNQPGKDLSIFSGTAAAAEDALVNSSKVY